jgi:surfeit locus 1 family protein
MTGFRPLFWPTLFTAPAVLLLLALGFWQVERLFWKQDLIAQRQAAVAVAPVAAPRSWEEARGMEFRHVTAEGAFLNDKEIFIGATSEAGRQGYHVLTPLLEASGRVVFVNRGFIPAELKDPTKRAAGQIAGTVRVQGLLRLPPVEKPAWFLPDNRPDLKYDQLAGAQPSPRIGRPPLRHLAAHQLDRRRGQPRRRRLAQRRRHPRCLPNDHLQTRLRGFLAVALIVIYVLFHRRNADRNDRLSSLEERFRRSGHLEQADLGAHGTPRR